MALCDRDQQRAHVRRQRGRGKRRHSCTQRCYVCGQPGASFTVANDQDGVGNVNDASQATGLDVNFVAIYDVAFTATQTAARAALELPEHLKLAERHQGLWYGDSISDRSGNGRIDASL